MHNLAEQSKQAPLPRAPQEQPASQSYTPADAYRDTFTQRSAANTASTSSTTTSQNS